MGKLDAFYILFSENQSMVFSAGQTITGSVIVTLNAPMDMRGTIFLI